MAEDAGGLATKRCSRCASLGRPCEKPAGDFYGSSARPSGYSVWCKSCYRERDQARALARALARGVSFPPGPRPKGWNLRSRGTKNEQAKAPEGFRLCTRCARLGRDNAVQPIEEFHVARARRDGLTPWCRRCFREQAQVRGTRSTGVVPTVPVVPRVSEEQVLAKRGGSLAAPVGSLARLIAEQRGVCASCGHPERLADEQGQAMCLVLYGNPVTQRAVAFCQACMAAASALRHSGHFARRLASLLDRIHPVVVRDVSQIALHTREFLGGTR